VCGASTSQKALGAGSANFYNTLKNSYAQNFGSQSAILSNLTNALQPILQGGPNQQGFSAAENAAMNSQAINNAATANRNAQVIAGSNVGGNTGVTTGGQKQLQAQIATGVGNNLSNNLNQITQANYATGRQNFFGAESALSGVASQYNPTAYAGRALNAGNEAFGQASQLQQMKNQEQADIGGMVAGFALAPFTGGMSLSSAAKGLGGVGGGVDDMASSAGSAADFLG